MRFCSPPKEPANGWRRVLFFVFFFLLFSSTFARAQDVAEAARQERVRRAAEQKITPHVYTNEDLRRDKILTAEDRARVEAQKKQQPPIPGQQNAESMPLDPSQQTESLGEIARRYRREKEVREAQQAAKKGFAPFSYKVPDQSVASPKPETAPLIPRTPGSDLGERPKLSPLPVPRFSSAGNSSRARISPFQPRPLLATPPALRVAPINPPAVARVEHSAVPALPPAPALEKTGLRPLQVQRGDSWWKLAERYLGSGTRWQELRSLNGTGKVPAKFLRQGSIILVPHTPSLRTALPRLHIVVKKGDTLWSLARAHLGRGSAWGCLASANPEIADYTRLAIGSVLRLPQAGTSESCQSPSSEGVPN